MSNEKAKKIKAFKARSGLLGGLRVNAEAYILVGGASSRFGTDKALVELENVPMYARMAALFRKMTISHVLVGDPAKYGNLGPTCIFDKWPGEGPLGGIITALRRTRATDVADYNLIVSCDMPFLTAEWFEHLLSVAFHSEADVVLARSDRGPEPLCACWRTDAVATLEAAFMRGVRRVNEGIALLRAEVLDERDWKRFDSAGRLFWNMNTQADYEEAKRVIESGGI